METNPHDQAIRTEVLATLKANPAASLDTVLGELEISPAWHRRAGRDGPSGDHPRRRASDDDQAGAYWRGSTTVAILVTTRRGTD